ncbi:MAG: transketolase family protein [Oscillospiraceae bacterium]|nr:transketolase family protein [Oscillospiraceae bacterium]
MAEMKSLRIAYGEALVQAGKLDDRIVVLDADVSSATMTNIFKKAYPDRHYNFGIAEANMVCAATGMAQSGLIPFVSTFALFGAARAFEPLRNSVAYMGANVKLGLSHSGLSVGEDGGSHQAVEDIALMRLLPGMTIFVPCDAFEMEKAVKAAVEIDGPVYIRVARPVTEYFTAKDDPFVPGKANILRDGKDAAIFAAGLMIEQALAAAKILEGEGISAAVVNFHTIKPFDQDTALEFANRCGVVVTAEEHSIIGGLGSAVAQALMGKANCKFDMVGIRDSYGKSGDPALLFKEYGLTAEDIAGKVRDKVGI